MTISTEVMFQGFATGIVLGTMSTLFGFIIKAAFRWMGF